MNFVVEKSTQQEGSARAKGVTLPGNFPVPVLAEPSSGRCKSGNSETSGNDGEARESARNKHSGATLNLSGGENNLSGGVEKRTYAQHPNRTDDAPSKSDGSADARAAVTCDDGSGSSAPPAQNFC